MSTGIEARFRVDYAGFSLDVDLALPGRGVSALYGHSGSGKTTCLRCMAGLAPVSRGYLRINGEVWLDTEAGIAVPTHRRSLGYVFQEASLFDHMTVQRNLAFGLNRIPAAERRVDLLQAAELLGIAHLLERMPAGLSGGERQRVGIARALLTSPRLLLMDEPLASLDVARKQEILPYLERLHGELDIPVIYVSHSPDEVARLADHLVLLSAGRAMASGAIAQMLTRLDLPLAMADDASVVVSGTVAGFDPGYQLMSVRLPGSVSCLRVVHGRLPPGTAARLAVKARDVSITLVHPEQSSIVNVIPVRVQDMASADHPDHILVRLDADGTPLLARITRYSRDQLGLVPGTHAWAQIKAVSVLA
ncbi:molybdenum ABC transporter ATP-binding protein [Bordetella genomosp. 4]|uniref:Molybdenum ABC transporter ATP-binding protein n=1 Tax=Bordetella genomosp. 4 TaxID=463044 RepID=A0A261TNC1_9BORD|nr:molybdenum ABC transporter ATP-binding protein [Bordetella genomosp. 4]OZI42959.1 molybdenum ABC transporter ATP-binding protein [Bordetella genomosp. 4]OZI50520.1 molybdenum ABC transporter ATP-binding protein [Bordetella genomosp. 4]